MMQLVPTPIEEAFQATVIEDSISPYGIRLTTFQLRYPRFIHAEFMTHRQFSRNARSSRAVPARTLRKETPYIPHFLANQKGMQAFEELPPKDLQEAINMWLWARATCTDTSRQLDEVANVHKQWANRMLEWFGYIDVVVTSTYWRNFFNLRDHPAAMPEIQNLAIVMRDAMAASTPREVGFGDCHLPFILVAEYGLPLVTKKLLSTARCARVSYKPFDSETADPEKDAALAKKLILEDPLHASPAEHQASPDKIIMADNTDSMWAISHNWEHPELHGNFCGWQQHRKEYPNEACNEDYSTGTLIAYAREHHGQDEDITSHLQI